MLVGCATAASLFPFVGTIVYMILRPPEYLEDVHERELEVQAAEARLHDLDHSLCPHCDYRIERDFVRCPSCLRKLKERCVNCSRPLDQAWTICPYCETEVAPHAPPRRTRRRRTQAQIDAERGELGSGAGELSRETELAAGRPETARAKATRERREREAEAVPEARDEDELAELAGEQETRATPVVASEPANGGPGASRSSRRARPSA
jgi:hypothetical protein